MQAVKDSEALRKAVEETQPLQVKFGLRLSQSRPLYEGFRCACGPLLHLTWLSPSIQPHVRLAESQLSLNSSFGSRRIRQMPRHELARAACSSCVRDRACNASRINLWSEQTLMTSDVKLDRSQAALLGIAALKTPGFWAAAGRCGRGRSGTPSQRPAGELWSLS